MEPAEAKDEDKDDLTFWTRGPGWRGDGLLYYRVRDEEEDGKCS